MIHDTLLLDIEMELIKLFMYQIQFFKDDITNAELEQISTYLRDNEFSKLRGYTFTKIDLEIEQYYILSGIISQLQLVNYLIMHGG